MNSKSYLYALCFSVPLMGAAVQTLEAKPSTLQVVAGAAATNTWCTYESGYGLTEVFIVHFAQPMVEESEVGKPVAAVDASGKGWYTLTPGDLTVEATWVSTSSFQVKLKTCGTRTMCKFTVPEGLTSLSGGKMQGLSRYIGDGSAIPLYQSEFCTNQNTRMVFFSSDFADGSKEMAAAIPHAYYLVTPKGGAEYRVPAPVRQATAGDVTTHWEEFSGIFPGWDDTTDDEKFFRSQDPATPVPGLWCVDFPFMGDDVERMALKLPGVGGFSEKTGAFEDLDICTFNVTSFYVELTNARTGVGEYRLTLTMNQAVPMDVEGMLRNGAWEMCAPEGEVFEPLTWDEERQAFIGTCEAGEVTLRLDKEATLATAKTYPMPGGGEMAGVGTIVLKATTPAPGVRIRSLAPMKSIYGKVYAMEGDDDKRFLSSMTTRLTPKRPVVCTDMGISGLQGEGRHCIHCYTEEVSKVQVRVYRIESPGNAVPRLLQGYSKLYKYSPDVPDEQKFFVQPSRCNTLGLDASSTVPTVLLPGRPAKAETVLEVDEKGECSLDPASLFPGMNPHATYFVEIQGDVAPEADAGRCVLNQGVVQVTDLGLMWKLSSGRIFAYVYRLSDGKQVEAANVLMLDAEGREIGRLAVKDGTGTADMPEGVCFLQVQSGDDCYTTCASRSIDLQMGNGYWLTDESYLLDRCVDPSRVIRTQADIFKDRSLYRKGETSHIKGVLRSLQGNTLSIPEVESVTATVTFGGDVREFTATCETDGTFYVDIPIEETWYGYGDVEFTVRYKGDADGTAPDIKAFRAAGAAGDELDVAFNYTLRENRNFYTSLVVQDFRRNEFEVSSNLEVDPATRTAKVSATAKDFNTAPVALGKATWWVSASRVNFYPAKFKDYRFGDCTCGDGWYFSVYYGNGFYGCLETTNAETISALDEKGCGSVELALPEFNRPGRYRVTSHVSITNGNEQTLSSERTVLVESSSVYAGLSGTDALVKAGDPIRLHTILVTPEGEAYAGAPLRATVKVTRSVFNPTRYGSMLRSAVRNEKTQEEYPAREISISGQPAPLEIPTAGAGIYDISIEGTDAEGRPYYTAVRKYVWGDDVSPWEYENGTGLELTANKPVYQVGETAKILVQTPVDAELLVTVEREGVVRHFTRSITVANPILELPIEAGDAPFVRVSVFLVQGAKERTNSGVPVIKEASIDLHIDMPEKRLGIQLEVPQTPVMPTDVCTISGVVTDAAGNPVPHAELALYAEDEGTLQVIGYQAPDLYDTFYGSRLVGVATFNTLGQLIGDVTRYHDYGNKGVFIGGGDEDTDSAATTDPTVDRGPRRDFNPCALWLGHVTTDENGRFSATYTNPDTMTRYRVIAVASADADKFGTAQSAYVVAQPVMLEPSAPLSAAEGDCIDVPVTVTMLPSLMPAGTPADVAWNVTLQGTNCTTPVATRSVTLHGDAPSTIQFPVTMTACGPVELTWSVQPAEMRPGMEKFTDSVALGFEVVPATPHLRLPIVKTLKPGGTVKPVTLLSEALRPDSQVQLTLSLSPLSGAIPGVEYLFHYPYGCAEQLSSTLLPWLIPDTMEKWVEIPLPKDASPRDVEKKTVAQLRKRQLGSKGFAYWEGEHTPSDFSPYVCYILSYSSVAMEDCMMEDRMTSYLRSYLHEGDVPNMLAFMALARMNPESAVSIAREVKEKRKVWTLEDRLMYACALLECQERLGDGIEAGSPFEILLKDAVAEADKALKADKGKTQDRFDYYTPPKDALVMLYSIKSGKPKMVEYVHNYVQDNMADPVHYNTWRNAWVCIVIHEFCQRYGSEMQPAPAMVNSQEIKLGEPQRISCKLSETPKLTLKGRNPVYLTGMAVGYTVKPQKVEAVDKGFLVERRYEKLLPDGTWQPAATFEVGDIVRVTFTASVSNPTVDCYLAAEDRLPAGFEAVNPDLVSQGLPDFIMKNKRGYWWSSPCFNRTEYHKDRVCFFASSLHGAKKLEASYIVRVVKSGHMTAPAAKVEMMYRPGVYGLSIPQEFNVTPRKYCSGN